MPKISVIIPVYNTKPHYIKEAINSVLNQTLKDIEIIIVNDGSTDQDTINFLTSISHTIKVITQENKGLGGARNTGKLAAEGDCIAFLDSDDWLDENFYEYLYNLIIENDADFACGNLMRVTATTQFCFDKNDNTICTSFTDKFKYVTNGSICSKLFTRKIFESIFFSENIYWEDNPVLVELLLKSNRVVYTDKVNYYYRENSTSICLNPHNAEKRIKDGLTVLTLIKNLIKRESRNTQEVVLNFFSFLLNKGAFLNNKKYRKKAYKIYKRTELNKKFGFSENSLIENIFSLKNSQDKRYKVITISGLKVKVRRRNKIPVLN